jgi:hypothetical protein
MRWISLTLVTAAALGLGLAYAAQDSAPAQDPPAQAPEGARPLRGGVFYNRGIQDPAALLGAWQITSIDLPGTPTATGDATGYALFLDGYMSLELHYRYPYTNPDPDFFNIFFQSGTHRWRVDQYGRLETWALIGANNMNEDESLYFESPGTQRVLEAELAEDELVLTKDDGETRIRMKRLGKLPFPRARATGTGFVPDEPRDTER